MKSLLFGLLTLTILTSCSGGNGDGSVAGPTIGALTHNQLAEKFVQEINLDGEFSVDLVKKSTLQENFIVIYDPYTESYDALNIDNYNPNYDDAADYYFSNSARGFFDLDIIPGHYETEFDYTVVDFDDFGNPVYGYEPYDVWVPTRYQDPASGLTFEKAMPTSKDLAKVVALKEAIEIQKSAEFLSAEFGLSLNRGKEIAALQSHWKKVSKKSMTNLEVDTFATELLGFSLTTGIEAYNASLAGNSSSLESLVQQSANANGITPEHATQLMTKVFGP